MLYNYPQYTSIIIFIFGIILLLTCNKNNNNTNILLSLLIISLGISSYLNHSKTDTNKDIKYSINKWHTYRIYDWTMVILIFCYLFYRYKYNLIFLYFLTLTFIFIPVLCWNKLLNNNLTLATHAFFHVFFILIICILINL